MEPSKRGRFGAPSLSISRSSLLGVIRRWTWYGEVGDIDEREFGEDVSLSAGSALIFIADMPPPAELGTVRRLPSKLATFLQTRANLHTLVYSLLYKLKFQNWTWACLCSNGLLLCKLYIYIYWQLITGSNSVLPKLIVLMLCKEFCMAKV